jgi:hypothetical protein
MQFGGPAGRVGGTTARRATSKSNKVRITNPAACVRPVERADVGGFDLQWIIWISGGKDDPVSNRKGRVMGVNPPHRGIARQPPRRGFRGWVDCGRRMNLRIELCLARPI